MENITRISDLPDQNNSVQNSISEQSTQPQTNYTPINIHPNPYGISGQNPIITNQENQMKQNIPSSHNARSTLQSTPVGLTLEAIHILNKIYNYSINYTRYCY